MAVAGQWHVRHFIHGGRLFAYLYRIVGYSIEVKPARRNGHFS